MGEKKCIGIHKRVYNYAYWKWKRCVMNPSMDVLKHFYLLYYGISKSKGKKILGIWDFNERTGTLGDVIVFLEVLNVLREKFYFGSDKKKNIDICYIDDKDHPNSKKTNYSKTYDWKKNMRLTTVVNPYVDSIFYFSSNSEFEMFYEKNKKRYVQWPPIKSNMVPYDNRIIIDFYQKNKYLPKLSIPQDLLGKIYDFYEEHVYPSKPVILNIRKNTRMQTPNQNSDITELKKFLVKYKNNKNYKFIIICYKAEIPEELRGIKNVIFSKDYFDSIEDDLTLIKTSYISIFPPSGVSAFAFYSGVPAIQYGLHTGRHAYFMGPFNQKKFNYLSDCQRIYFGKETGEELISKFEDLAGYLEKNNINNNLENRIKDNKKFESLF